MKKIFIISVAIIIIFLMFTGCTTSLEANTTSVEKQTVAKVSPDIFLWIDESGSISEDEMCILSQAAEEYTGLKNAYGPYPFGGGVYGSETADGWTDLVEPLKASGHNSKVYVFTDGQQENPQGFNQSSFAGPYWGIEVHYMCLEKDAYTEQLKETLENSKEYFKGSSVVLEYLDGTSKDVIIDEFEPQEITVSYEDNDTLYEAKIPWWVWLLPLLLLFIFLLWWIFRRKKDTTTGDESPNGDLQGTPAASGGTASAGTPVASEETSEVDGVVAPTPVEELESSPTATTIGNPPESQVKCCCCCPYQKNKNILAIVAIACVAIVAIAAVALVIATI